MGDISTDCTFELTGIIGHSYYELIVSAPATTDTGDTIPITLSKYGATKIKHIRGFSHTTTDSVVVAEQPTTAISAGVLTITVGGTLNSDKKRFYKVLIA